MAQVYGAERGGMAEERKKSVLKGTKRNVSANDLRDDTILAGILFLVGIKVRVRDIW